MGVLQFKNNSIGILKAGKNPKVFYRISLLKSSQSHFETNYIINNYLVFLKILFMNSSSINFPNSLTKIIFPVLENMQIPVAVIEPQFNNINEIFDFSYVFINDYGSKSYSLLKENILGKTLLELFPFYTNNGVFDKLKSVYEKDVQLNISPNSPQRLKADVLPSSISFCASKFDNYIIMNWLDTSVIRSQLKTIKLLQNSNEELEQFAYIASHDLQEPIRMVISFTQLLQKRYADKLDDDAREFIAFAVDGAKRMKELIDNLLVYSRAYISTGKYEKVAVESIIKNIQEDFKILLNETGTKITYGDLPVIYTDVTMLHRLLTNLISNAIKFRQKKAPEINISAVRNNSEWIFSVNDNGIGIEEKYYEKVFMIFQRLHGKSQYPGTGLGLAICKRIIDRLEGKIWLESQPDKGTTFYFTIPIKE